MAHSFNAHGVGRRVFRLVFYGLVLSLFIALGVNVTSSSAMAVESSYASGHVLQTRSVFATHASTKLTHHVIPTFTIVSVDKGNSVTIRTQNYPANQNFKVMMGPMFSRAINGTVVGSFNSGNGGSFEQTFEIPDSLKDASRIAIRAQTAHAHPYYSFNWFHNVTAPAPVAEPDNDAAEEEDEDEDEDEGGETAVTPAPIYTGTPSFKVCQVSQNSSVTIATSALPANQTFTVRMGAFGTAGIGGVIADTFESGDGEAVNVSIDIPASLQGHGRIAIRIHTAHAYPYYAYNWFYNNTASVC